MRDSTASSSGRRPPKRTSRLIFDERPLLVPPTLAVALGLNEALFIQQLHYWLSEHAAGREIDGRRWIYNTYDSWREQFPFWSIATIRRVIGGLEKSGYVLSTEEFNSHGSIRTKWYTLDYDRLDALADQVPESAAHLLTLSSPPAQIAPPHLRNLSSSIKEPETTPKTTPENDESIEPTPHTGDNWDQVDYELVRRFISGYAREFGDEAPLDASVARAAGIWAKSGVEPPGFVAAMNEAATRTKRFTGSITKVRADGGGKNKMAYFFGILGQLLEGKRSLILTPSERP